ncbi:serine hydrolase [Sulfitobacter mediterraneus]|uniref:serine hydrolase domain-containing protein n=1 Tax=Sulfitobacter mediterraneus TaxID=83219 RepID=UPI0019347792|nr:serine hydrolase [Sulfitobacter mediterraneus]MBM1311483.1 serine hydrolase [Sulfitobacter mediterraneus]MBM1315365.1 serine hydrolase [Sulfitobacter mediterraneus]MBM1323726.1 serine hydrolase [Sulfitobacter mediterraneus]MBM1327638.1 serine hydrolase [Sulfitobacter mediterraneus]MBM1398986.1 serine hydrolase [Sulfitobacter mediterraneus]
MRRFGKWLGRLLLALVLAAVVVGLWKREEITRLLAVNSLFSAEKIVSNFSHMDAAFLTTPVPRGNGPTTALDYGPETTLPSQVDQWITDRTVTALVVLKDGDIVYENYFQGTGPDDLRISWSVAKSYLSALVGILLDEGKIASLDDPVTQYAPQLKGSAYDGATLRNVLQMSSGVTFDEDYLDKNSDINRMGRILALGGKMDDFTADLTERFAEPGQQWQYVSIDTHVIGMVVRGATGRSIADLLSEKIIVPLGLERSPYYVTDGVGTAFVLGGLNLTTRDYARFAQMFAQGGEWQGQQIVPAAWVAASTAASAPTAPGKIGYGYQWWIPQGAAPGEYMARGVYGQYLYIDTARNVVIATNAADRKFREAGVSQRNIDIFRLIAENL